MLTGIATLPPRTRPRQRFPLSMSAVSQSMAMKLLVVAFVLRRGSRLGMHDHG